VQKSRASPYQTYLLYTLLPPVDFKAVLGIGDREDKTSIFYSFGRNFYHKQAESLKYDTARKAIIHANPSGRF
jgi:hypothetical protein